VRSWHGNQRFAGWLAAVLAAGVGVASVQAPAVAEMLARPEIGASLVLEAHSSIGRGVSFLLGKQLRDGSWSRHPVITSYATLALANSRQDGDAELRGAIDRAVQFVADQAQADGSIWNAQTRQYSVYSTAISVLSLIRINRPNDTPRIRAARAYLLSSQQVDVPESDPGFGGFSPARGVAADLTTTQWVLEALYLTDALDRAEPAASPEAVQRADTAYQRAMVFVSRCQQMTMGAAAAGEPLLAPLGWFADGTTPGATGADVSGSTPRSIGFLTYAGLKSLLYARAPADDPCVVAAVAWARQHYRTDANPGLGTVGLYTYLYTMVKALKAYELNMLWFETALGVDWRREVVDRLLSLQHGTGEWLHSDPRWWETQPELVSAYALLTLEMVCGTGNRTED